MHQSHSSPLLFVIDSAPISGYFHSISGRFSPDLPTRSITGQQILLIHTLGEGLFESQGRWLTLKLDVRLIITDQQSTAVLVILYSWLFPHLHVSKHFFVLLITPPVAEVVETAS